MKYLQNKVESLNRPLPHKIVTLMEGACSKNIIDKALSSVSRSANTRLRDFLVSWDTMPKSDTKEAMKQLVVEYGYSVLYDNKHYNINELPTGVVVGLAGSKLSNCLSIIFVRGNFYTGLQDNL